MNLKLFTFLFISSFCFSQIIEKKEIIYPSKFYDADGRDSITYISTEKGVLILKFNSGSHQCIKEIDFFSEDIFTYIKGSQLLVKCSDTLYYFDISNPPEPVLINKWFIPVNLYRIFEFGPFFIFKFGYDYKLVTINNDSLRYIYDISLHSDAINYPYIILNYNNRLEFYKYSQSEPFYFERTIYDNNISAVSAGYDRLVYSTLYFDYSGPHAELKIIDLSDPVMPYLVNTNWYYDCKVAGIRQNTSVYFENKYWNYSSYANDYNTAVCDFNGIPILDYEDTVRIHFSGDKIYARKIDTIFYRKTPIPIKNFYESILTMPIIGKVIAYKDGKVKLKSIIQGNLFITTDSILYSGELTVDDSTFSIKEQFNYKLYTIMNDKIVLKDSLYFGDTECKKFIELGNFFYVKRENSFDIYRNLEPFPVKIFSSSEYPNTETAFLYNNLLYIVDKIQGLICYEINGDYITKKWYWGGTNNYSGEKTGNHLFVRKGIRMYLLDLDQSSTNAVFVDSLFLPSGSFGDLVGTPSAVFLKLLPGNPAKLLKLTANNNIITLNYNIPFTFTENFSLTESFQKLVVVTSKEIYWIKDTTLVSSLTENENTPLLFSLSQNYPNPFNPITKIKYSLQKRCFISLKIYDVLGKEKITLVSGEHSAGEHEVVFDASNFTSGVYFYQLISGSFTETKKLILIK